MIDKQKARPRAPIQVSLPKTKVEQNTPTVQHSTSINTAGLLLIIVIAVIHSFIQCLSHTYTPLYPLVVDFLPIDFVSYLQRVVSCFRWMNAAIRSTQFCAEPSTTRTSTRARMRLSLSDGDDESRSPSYTPSIPRRLASRWFDDVDAGREGEGGEDTARHHAGNRRFTTWGASWCGQWPAGLSSR